MKSIFVRSWFLLSLLTALRLSAAMTVSLQPSLPSPVPLGTPVVWTAAASGTSGGPILYRFRIQAPGAGFPDCCGLRT